MDRVTPPRVLETSQSRSEASHSGSDFQRQLLTEKAGAREKGNEVLDKAKAKKEQVRDFYTDDKFNTLYKTDVDKVLGGSGAKYEVIVQNKYNPKERYRNIIDLDNREIIMKENNKGGSKMFPNSEIVYQQYKAAAAKEGKSLSDVPIMRIRGDNTVNEETVNTITPLLKGESRKTFTRADPEFLDVVSTPACKGKEFLSQQRPELFGDRKLAKITVEKRPSVNAIDAITYEFDHIKE